ncbi:MAG: hypothetical protein FWC43_11445 [Planctomycetaceae bacterium]|nr:hypothetical protein [Planctomycetaceae bacterium]
MEIVSFASNSKVIAYCKKVAELPACEVRESIFNEFNMAYSDTEQYDHAESVWQVLLGYYTERAA